MWASWWIGARCRTSLVDTKWCCVGCALRASVRRARRPRNAAVLAPNGVALIADPGRVGRESFLQLWRLTG